MKLEIKEKTKRPLLDREEITALMSFEGATPSTDKVREEIAKQAKAKPELTVVRKIDVAYGSGNSVVSAYVYNSQESLEKTEREYMITKNKPAEKEEAAEEAEEPKKEAAEEPKEEAKEEASEEPKQESAEASEDSKEEEKKEAKDESEAEEKSE